MSTIEKSKIPLLLENSNIRINSNKSEDFTINKDEILKNIEEIQGLLRIAKDLQYIEDLNGIFEKSRKSESMYNVTWMK